ncbi:MAG: hypothetical protein Q4B52_04325 [Tissierellia bacterium]|nr:hypothetical protein [Tissierellia bacterium]
MDKKIRKKLKITYAIWIILLIILLAVYFFRKDVKLFPFFEMYMIFSLASFLTSNEMKKINDDKIENLISIITMFFAIGCATITFINKNLYIQSVYDYFKYVLFIVIIVWSMYNIFENKRTKNI